MPQQNNSELAGLWETELSKIQSLDSVSIPDFIGNFLEKMFSKIAKVFHLFDNLPDMKNAKTFMFYGFFVFMVLLIIFFVIKYFRRDIKNIFVRIFRRKKNVKKEYDYILMLQQGKYSEALRLLTKSVSEIYRLGNRTFRELMFGDTSNSDDLPDIYGRVIHKKETADVVSFESAENYASATYPEIKKIRSKRIKSGK
jgi:hypothetical protein